VDSVNPNATARSPLFSSPDEELNRLGHDLDAGGIGKRHLLLATPSARSRGAGEMWTKRISDRGFAPKVERLIRDGRRAQLGKPRLGHQRDVRKEFDL
jgi:hypothetical protein